MKNFTAPYVDFSLRGDRYGSLAFMADEGVRVPGCVTGGVLNRPWNKPC